MRTRRRVTRKTPEMLGHILRCLNRKHVDDWADTEVCTGPGCPHRLDFLAIRKSYASPCFAGYEIKVDRQDFLGDQKWPNYLSCCHTFSFVTPTGLVTKEDIRSVDASGQGVGLYYVNPENPTFVKTVVKPLYRHIDLDPSFLLSVIICRLSRTGNPFYSTTRHYFEEWVDDKIRTKELGMRVKSKIFQKLTKMEQCACDSNRDTPVITQEQAGLLSMAKTLGCKTQWDLLRLKSSHDFLSSLAGGEAGARDLIDILDRVSRFQVYRSLATLNFERLSDSERRMLHNLIDRADWSSPGSGV